MKDHIAELISRSPDCSVCMDQLRSATDIIVASYRRSGMVLTCGNGGSAADAEHIVGELMKGFLLKRGLDESEVSGLEAMFPGRGHDMAGNLQRAVSAVALTGNICLSTAFANDVNPEYVFAQQVYGLGRAGDTVICLSTSGNSRNVVNAAMIAKFRGLHVISFTGRHGGALKEYSDVTVMAPSSITPQIQEYHLSLYHALCAQVEAELFM